MAHICKGRSQTVGGDIRMRAVYSQEPASHIGGEAKSDSLLNPTFSDLGSPKKTDWVVLFDSLYVGRHSRYPN